MGNLGDGGRAGEANGILKPYAQSVIAWLGRTSDVGDPSRIGAGEDALGHHGFAERIDYVVVDLGDRRAAVGRQGELRCEMAQVAVWVGAQDLKSSWYARGLLSTRMVRAWQVSPLVPFRPWN